ncbi:MAG TPA: hypothetical protein VLJ57_13190 [Burkholderiaceae bacterium]|nr:hypothetical protein [Burkholderiaceae bacterium]
MTQLVAVDGDRSGLGLWCLDSLAPRLAAHAGVQGLMVNLAQDNPLPELYPGESLQGDDFDVIVQSWVSSRAEWLDALEPIAGELSKRCARRFDYRVDDFTVKNDETALSRAYPTAGYKLMRGLVFHSDLAPAAARRQWAHHAKLAVRVHVGVARYTQHWVEEVLSPGAPAIGGFSDLHFPSLEAMRDRYFVSSHGKEEILHDIGHFIASGSKRFYGQEYLVK